MIQAQCSSRSVDSVLIARDEVLLAVTIFAKR